MLKKLQDNNNKHSSGSQFGVLSNGIRVRDPSQMFVFGGTSWVQESAGSLTKNKSQQEVIFGKSLIDIDKQSNGFENPKKGDCGRYSSGNVFGVVRKVDEKNNNSVTIKKVPKSEPVDAFTISYDDHKNASQGQKTNVKRLDPSRIAQPTGLFSKPKKSPKSENDKDSNENYKTSNLVSVKKEGGQRRSTEPGNIRLDAPDQQPVIGSSKLPSASSAANRRIKRSSVPLWKLESDKRHAASTISKKRKVSTFKRLPWREEVTGGSSRLRNISTAEVEWARNVVRQPEKLKELAEKIAYSCLITSRKRRLCLTTQLMQLLFPPPPANILTEDAITHCDIVTYYASKLALGNACRLCSSADKNMTSKRSREQDLSKVIEGFIDKSKTLTNDVSRLEKAKPFLSHEVKMDFQSLEKVSFVNRLAKYHNQISTTVTRPIATVDASSSSTKRKRFLEKYVTVIPMPKSIPEGQDCLLL